MPRCVQHIVYVIRRGRSPRLRVVEFGPEQLGAELAERVDVAARHEPVAADPVVVAQQAEFAETMHHLERGLVGRTDERHLRPHDVADRAGEERIVGAPQQQRVDGGLPDRGEQPFGEHHHLVAAGLAPLDELHEPGAGRARQRHGSSGLDDRVEIRARRHRADGADDTHSTGDRGLHQGAGPRRDHVDDGNREFVTQVVEAGRRGRVAGDHDRLGVVVLHEAPRQFVRVRPHVCERLGSVRDSGQCRRCTRDLRPEAGRSSPGRRSGRRTRSRTSRSADPRVCSLRQSSGAEWAPDDGCQITVRV